MIKNIFLKIKPFYFILLALFITILEFFLYKEKIVPNKLIILTITISFCAYSYMNLVLVLNSRKYKIVNIISYFDFIKNDGKRYHSNLIKVVVFEEVIYRIVPLALFSIFNLKNLFSTLLIILLFTLSHNKVYKKSLYLVLEFFFYFFIVTYIYNCCLFFPILIIPHFMRNSLIEYHLRNTRNY